MQKNHPLAKKEIIGKIKSEHWNLVILCTQKSLSNLISMSVDTMQHVIGEEMKNDIELNNTYKLFSKIDATRPENSKKIIFSNNKKFRNVRIRCWINFSNVYVPDTINQDFIKSTSYKSTNNSLENYYSTGSHNSTESASKIRLVKYQYKRLTQTDDTKRQLGEGAIIVSFILKKGREKYQYVVCNYDSTSINLNNITKNKGNNVEEGKKNPVRNYFKELVNKDNEKNRKDKNKIINLDNKMTNQFSKYKKKINIDNLFLSYLSCNSIIYKYLKTDNDPSFYSCLWGLNKRTNTGKSTDKNLTFEQIPYIDVSKKPYSLKSVLPNSSSASSIPQSQVIQQQNMTINRELEIKNLLNIIYTIYEFQLSSRRYEKDLSIKENINLINITKSMKTFIGVELLKNETTYDYILRKLKEFKSDENNSSSVNIMLNIWEKIDKSQFIGGYMRLSSLLQDLKDFFNNFLKAK